MTESKKKAVPKHVIELPASPGPEPAVSLEVKSGTVPDTAGFQEWLKRYHEVRVQVQQTIGSIFKDVAWPSGKRVFVYDALPRDLVARAVLHELTPELTAGALLVQVQLYSDGHATITTGAESVSSIPRYDTWEHDTWEKGLLEFVKHVVEVLKQDFLRRIDSLKGLHIKRAGS